MAIGDVLSPTEWRAQVDYDLWEDVWTEKDKLICHYGGNASFAGDRDRALSKGYSWPSIAVEIAALRIYEQTHLSRGWRGLAYAWAIGQSGTIYRIRAFNRYGAHKGDLEPDGIPENEEGIPILFILGGDQEPTDAAKAAFFALRAELEMELGVELPVYGHKEIALLGTGTTTSCPGKVMALVDEARLDKEELVDFISDETWAQFYADGHIEGDSKVMPAYYFVNGGASREERINALNVALRSMSQTTTPDVARLVDLEVDLDVLADKLGGLITYLQEVG